MVTWVMKSLAGIRSPEGWSTLETLQWYTATVLHCRRYLRQETGNPSGTRSMEEFFHQPNSVCIGGCGCFTALCDMAGLTKGGLKVIKGQELLYSGGLFPPAKKGEATQHGEPDEAGVPAYFP